MIYVFCACVYNMCVCACVRECVCSCMLNTEGIANARAEDLS